MIYKFQNSGTMPQVDATRVAMPPREYKRTTIHQDHDALVKWNLEHPNDKVYRIEDLIQKEKEANPSWIKKIANTVIEVPATAPAVGWNGTSFYSQVPKVKSTVGKELGYTMGLLTAPALLSELGTYGLIGGGLRLSAGSAAAAGASYVGGKAGDWLDNKLGTNWIGDTNRLVLPFITFPVGMKGANSILRSAAGHGITMGMPQETFMNLRGQYFTNAGNKALVNLNSKPNPILTSTINHLYKEYPELSLIGPKEAYRQYYETIFPASKVQTPYVHGTKSDLSGGLETSVKIPNAAAPETIGRNDFYLNLQPETSLQYADGIGVPRGFTWNKHRFWPLKEILGKPYKSDAWMSEPIKLREQVPNRAGQFSRVKNADGTYSGHGKLLEEYKAELGMQDLSNEEFLQRLGVQNEESFNQWVAKNRQMFSDIYDSGDYHGLYHVKIDANKPLTIDGGNTYYSERGIWNRMNKGGNDVLLHNNAANEFGSDVAVVRDVTPQKVRILGSKPDQQGFADFMGGKQQFFTEIPTSPQEAATTYHFDGRMPLTRPISEAELKGWPKQFRNQRRGQISASEYSGLPKGERNNGRYGDLRFIRHIDVVPELTKDGFVQVAPEENWLANFTTDQLMVPHKSYSVEGIGKNVLVISPEAFRGTTPFSLDPGDSFFINRELKIKPKHVTFISGDPQSIQLAKERGFNVETSPKLKILSELSKQATWEELQTMRPALEKRGYWFYGREYPKIKSDYVDELNRILDSRFNRPSLKDYSNIESVTGVPTHTYSRSAAPWQSFFGPKTGYQQAIYDTTPKIEHDLMKQIGSYAHPMAESMEGYSPLFFRLLKGWTPIKKQGGKI